MAKAGKAKLIDIFVWDTDTNEVLANLKGFHLRAVRMVNKKYNKSLPFLQAETYFFQVDKMTIIQLLFMIGEVLKW